MDKKKKSQKNNNNKFTVNIMGHTSEGNFIFFLTKSGRTKIVIKIAFQHLNNESLFVHFSFYYHTNDQ